MYRMPSSRCKFRKKASIAKPNLIPILDAVFIFVFFLLMSANFIQIFEISSDVPIISDTPPKKKRPLALTLKIRQNGISIYTGVPSKFKRKIGKTSDGKYDLHKLHQYLVRLKKRNLHENTAILEPVINIQYQEIIEIMDSVRIFENTDEAIYKKNSQGINEKVKKLFDQIVFGNILS